MRKLVFAAAFFLAAGAFAAPRPKARSFLGQIMDEPCAKQGNHKMGYQMTGTHTPKDCTIACANAGAKIVLYNPATKTIYLLDNQAEAREFAGQTVEVFGTYDPRTRTIHVEKIAAKR
jgi:hypothetical protein